MLILDIKEKEIWDPLKRIFVFTKPVTLKLEHSLISISKWESIVKKPYLHTKLTPNLLKFYIKCMTLNQNVEGIIYKTIDSDECKKVLEYITDSMSATTFDNRKKGKINDEIVTSELIYYWMTVYNIPFECEKWHLKRLMNLITICSLKMEKPQKMSKSDIYARNRAINARNRAKYHTKG